VAFFTEALGFAPADGTGQGRARLSLRRPLPQWSMTLILEEEVAPPVVPTMDSEGWFVLALLSSDLNADASAASQHALKAVTEPFEICVGGKPWMIVLCVLHCGFAIELMQPPRADSAVGRLDAVSEQPSGG
jgi:hypothetical protein